jgi:PTS system, fructose-specific, IIB component
MNIIGITACTAGIAHTYIAKEKLVRAAEARNHHVKIETQGTIGIEDELTVNDIKTADVVIIAADIGIKGLERFEGKRVVNVATSIVIKSPNVLLEKIEQKICKVGG